MNLKESSRLYNGKSETLAALTLLGNFAVYFGSLAVAIAYVQLWYVLIPALLVHGFAGVRLYVLQHDCGHLALWPSRRANERTGLLLSTFTATPFKVMQYNHNLHHAHVGELDHREAGEVYTMTLKEWQAAGPWRRLYYRVYRNPLVMIPVGAFWTYFIRYRWPKNTRKVGVAGVLLHDALFLAYFVALYLVAGWAGPLVLFAGIWLAGMIGVFLVYLQHNFEGTYWAERGERDFVLATIQGSSCLDFGWVFDEAVANITKHDIHHFNPSIPSYRLRQAHREMREDFALRRIGFGEALHSFRLKLWDEESDALVPFPGASVAQGAGEMPRAA
ncbi:fatty acid desaturase [Aquicoccus sp. SCR17]|nr:fatty acid desaturase [Carideicomes alvinocaridis]